MTVTSSDHLSIVVDDLGIVVSCTPCGRVIYSLLANEVVFPLFFSAA